MKKTSKNNLRNRLITLFLLISLIPNIAVITVTYLISLNSISTAVHNEINEETRQIADSLDSLIENKRALLNNTGNAPSIVATIAGDDMINLTDRERTITFFERLVDDGAFSYVLLINHNAKYLVDRSQQVWRRDNLEVIDGIKTNLARFIDASHIEELPNQAGVLLSIPSNGGAIVGVIPMSEFHAVIEDIHPLEKETHVILFNQNNTVIYPSSDLTIEKFKLLAQQTTGSGSNSQEWKDAQGNTYLYGAASTQLENADFSWNVFALENSRTAFLPIHMLGLVQAIAAVLTAVVIIIASYVVGTMLSKPISKLADVTDRMASGNLKVYIPDESKITEIKTLRDAVLKLQNSLLFQITSINEMTGQIGSSVLQISASIAQLASNAAETTSSITEISATVEETRETSSVSASKAESVAFNSESVLETADEGQTATNKAVEGMQSIRDEMDAMANRISMLSEQIQSINSIINTVEDIAEQSNLLAVNAAIEAAKAGDAGAGFAVVAQEVKSLAEQSKTATIRVRTILEDIRKATSAAVLAAERSGKAVEIGAQRTAQVGDTIAQLAQSLSESADTSMQISLSSQEQLTGMNQLVQAIDAIQAASSQNMDATRQIEYAIRELNNLSTNLNQIVSEFDL